MINRQGEIENDQEYQVAYTIVRQAMAIVAQASGGSGSHGSKR